MIGCHVTPGRHGRIQAGRIGPEDQPLVRGRGRRGDLQERPAPYLVVPVQHRVVGLAVDDGRERAAQRLRVEQPGGQPKAAGRVGGVGGVAGEQDPSRPVPGRRSLIHPVRGSLH
jgi:hypothetical protein